jgi:hypothetical protein
MYVRKDIIARVVSISDGVKELEDLWVEVRRKDKICTIGGVYIPPGKKAGEQEEMFTELNAHIGECKALGWPVWMVEDFNAHTASFDPQGVEEGVNMIDTINKSGKLLMELVETRGGWYGTNSQNV